MYNPPHFKITDTAELHRIIDSYPLGTLVTQFDGLDANHLPFEFDPKRGEFGTLTAHVARANPLCQVAAQGGEVMVIFRGAEGYISPNWYPSKHETHRLVPTWNYEVVHAHGAIKLLDDEKFVRGVVARLTREHEATEAKPWKMGDSSPEYINGMLAAIVGLEITITRLEGKAKLSQNRELRDRQGAVKVLQDKEREALAASMAKHAK
jgi:transcriptional regulator